MHRSHLLLAVVASTLCLAPAAEAAGLLGSQVSASVHCCTAPTEAYRFSNIATAPIGSGVEFPTGSLVSAGGSFYVIPLTIDMGESSIDIQYQATDTAASGAFNGYKFVFAGAAPITGVSVNPLSTLQPVDFSFSGDSVLVNVASRRFSPTARILLDVTTEATVDPPRSVPESMPSLSILGAILGLGLRQRTKAQPVNRVGLVES